LLKLVEDDDDLLFSLLRDSARSGQHLFQFDFGIGGATQAERHLGLPLVVESDAGGQTTEKGSSHIEQLVRRRGHRFGDPFCYSGCKRSFSIGGP